MTLNWMDLSTISIKTLLLLERVQISWFPSFDPPRDELATALRAHPGVTWYLRHKCPEIAGWLDELFEQHAEDLPDLRQAEIAVLRKFEDLLIYVFDPLVYDAQPFLNWDSRELTDLVDFRGKTIIDVGAGTGRLTFEAEGAHAIFSVEPVANLRYYMRQKAQQRGWANVYPVDGLITEIPFPDGFADVTMGGHVFGDYPEAELAEMMRVTKSGGMVIFCPGNSDRDNATHKLLLERGFQWARFEEPVDGWKRKYWLKLD